MANTKKSTKKATTKTQRSEISTWGTVNQHDEVTAIFKSRASARQNRLESERVIRLIGR